MGAALIASPSVSLPLAIVRFIRFSEAGGSSGGGVMGGILGLLLRHLLESLLHRLPDEETTTAIFAPLQKYEDVREGMLLVLDGHLRPRMPTRTAAPQLHDKFRRARRELASSARD